MKQHHPVSSEPSLPVAELAKHCHADQLASRPNSPHCQALFDLALAHQDSQAWHVICEEFRPMVTGWVYNYTRFQHTGEEAAFFVNAAFARLWQYGSPHAQADRFQTVGDYLQYLKRCVWSAIEDHLRKSEKDALWQAVTPDPMPRSDEQAASFQQRPVEQSLIADEVVQILWEMTRDDVRERLVAQETWIYDLPPREIQARYPNHFATPGQVSQIRRNILRRLQRHPQLKKWLDR